MISANKTSRRALETLLITLAFCVFAGWPYIQLAMEDNRAFRDWVGLTPFSQVSVDGQEITEDGLAVWGVMRKDRCTFERLSAYVTLGDGTSHRVVLNDRPEREFGVTGNRPVSVLLQSWGPWIVGDPRFGEAVSYSIYAQHVGPPENCHQTNRFASGPWAESYESIDQ